MSSRTGITKEQAIALAKAAKKAKHGIKIGKVKLIKANEKPSRP